jgi:HEPN domain-containing protein
MEKEDFVKYWVKSSEHDLNVAESLFSSEHFDYCLFIAHLSLEKLLKAFWVIANPENIPPKTHNLIYLAKQTNLDLNDKQLAFLQLINTFNINTRYPDYSFKIHKKCNRAFTENYFNKIKEFSQWLKKKF